MDQYQQLRQILDKHLSGAPAHRALDEIMRILFTPEEVTVALGLSFAPRPAERVAETAGVSVEEARARCEAMADKGIVFARAKDGVTGYSLLPVVPGLFEFPLMKGGGDPVHERLGRLWEEYHRDALNQSFAGSRTPLTRIIPVEAAVGARPEVLPFEAVSRMLDTVSFCAVAHCACRVSADNCDAPREVCLMFDQTARFLVERGFAREVTKAEALDVVRRAEDAGLVHSINNSQDRLNLICNCCPCCCTILRGLTQFGNPHAFAVSKWQAEVDPDLCTACGVCADERCPMGAVAVEGAAAAVNADQCIGCGLCVSTCEAGAMTMVPRPGSADPPATAIELGMKVMTEKGKLEDFIKMMKK